MTAFRIQPDPAHLCFNDLLAEVRRLRLRAEINKANDRYHKDILYQIGYFRSSTTFCSLNLTPDQRDTLGRACDLSGKSPEETIAAALVCWMEVRAEWSAGT